MASQPARPPSRGAKLISGAGGSHDAGALNDALRVNARKAAAALGLPALHPAATAALQAAGDGPLEELLATAPPAELSPPHVRALCAAVLARGAGMRLPAYRPLKRLRLLQAPGVGDGGAEAAAEVVRDGCAPGIDVHLEGLECRNMS
jgi:hypothetical protein